MPAAIFKTMSRTLHRSALSERCVITLDGIDYPTRCLDRQQREPLDVENQIYSDPVHRISVLLAGLPRVPEFGDVITLSDGSRFSISHGSTVTNAGTIDAPVEPA
jgi:hypothetical protein